MDLSLILQLTGVTLGLLYLWLEYKANIWLWAVGIVMPMVHGYLYFSKGLYADSGMEVYYVLAGVYGWAMWKFRPQSEEKPLIITHTPLRIVPRLFAIYLVLHIALYFFLSRCTDSTVPFWDSFTTALSIVALWMLSRKFVEEWLVWLVVDATYVFLYFYKQIPYTGGLYTVYCVLAVVGYLRWKRQAALSKGQQNSTDLG
ncbi:MAG: nicotinamide riboside transporter PnuC [Muribaculaceae bacterium]|jgi:nicotinamide mononucleotide transporter|nr:nicotinamide riboside transporter PnuC [Muribaculaceae bacterium]